ncbi:MAG: HEAT repeat domain-containing protein [Treponema sp.]|nr:HEAT repeat domain-containing protein [Treponema sp.]
MTSAAIVFLLSVLGVIVLFLFVFFAARKLLAANEVKRALETREALTLAIGEFAKKGGSGFDAGIDEFVRGIQEKSQGHRAAADEVLLRALELPDAKYREHYLAIARRLDFPAECLAQVKSKNPGVSAMGCRRAGLYNVTEAADDMVAALDILSSENQFEILLGLSRLGAAEALMQAFEKIQDNIVISERALIEIISQFPKGKEKTKLYRSIIQSGMNSVIALFLKAADKDIARELNTDIVKVLEKGDKESRAAAVRCFSTLGADAPADELIVAMSDKDWEVRAIAARALSTIQDYGAARALYFALFDLQWWVRQNAANSLMNHPGYEILFVLAAEAGDEYARDSIISALENGGSPILLRSIRVLAA